MLKTKRSFYFLPLIILYIFQAGGISQDLPDYPERVFKEKLDSLKAIPPDLLSLEATEGSINPDEYKVGPGDKLFISISGVSEISHNLVINQEGWLYIPRVGGIDLKDLTLAGAKEKIVEEINRYYKNVEIFISLANFRKIKVSLTGDVKTPSIFVLTANSRLLDLIDISKGLNPTSDIRNIKVVSKDGSSNKYDFLSFLRFGNYEQNPILREGDVVIVDKVDKVVRIFGEIKYPATYEYVENESALDLLELAGGFTSIAKTDSIEVVSFMPDGKTQVSKYYSLNELKNTRILLGNKDNVIVRRVPEYLEDHYVRIDGFVRYPGWYKIIKNKTTLMDLIKNAGGFLEEASLTEATLTRTLQTEEKDPEYERLRLMEPKDMTEDEYDYFKAKSRQSTGRVVIDFADLFVNKNLEENVVLKRGDIITIPEKKNYIIMLGQFLNPGKIIYDSKYTIEDYITLSGGFGWRAIEDEVRVIKARTGEWIDADDVKKLEPGDTIWVPEETPGPKFWEVFIDALTIVGQLAAIVAAMTAVIIASR